MFSSFIQKAQSAISAQLSDLPEFPASGEPIEVPGSGLWTMRDAKRKADGLPCTLFECKKKNKVPGQVDAAVQGAKHWRSLRHPGVLEVLAYADTDTAVSVATPRVRPLSRGGYALTLGAADVDNETALKELRRPGSILVFELKRLLSTVRWLLVDAKKAHGALSAETVFALDGDGGAGWRLGLFDACADSQGPAAACVALTRHSRQRPHSDASGRAWQLDTSAAARLLQELVDPAQQMGRGLLQLAEKANSCATPMAFVDALLAAPFFTRSVVCDKLGLLENPMQLSDDECSQLLHQITQNLPAALKHPSLERPLFHHVLRTVEIRPPCAPAAVPAICRLSGSITNPETFARKAEPVLLSLLAKPDRGIRFHLLTGLTETVLSRFKPKVLAKTVVPKVTQGLLDSSVSIREATVKAIFALGIVLTNAEDDATVGTLLEALLNAVSSDRETAVRANAVICLGKLAVHSPALGAPVASAVAKGIAAGLSEQQSSEVHVVSLNALRACADKLPVQQLEGILPRLALLTMNTKIGRKALEIQGQLAERILDWHEKNCTGDDVPAPPEPLPSQPSPSSSVYASPAVSPRVELGSSKPVAPAGFNFSPEPASKGLQSAVLKNERAAAATDGFDFGDAPIAKPAHDGFDFGAPARKDVTKPRAAQPMKAQQAAAPEANWDAWDDDDDDDVFAPAKSTAQASPSAGAASHSPSGPPASQARAPPPSAPAGTTRGMNVVQPAGKPQETSQAPATEVAPAKADALGDLLGDDPVEDDPWNF